VRARVYGEQDVRRDKSSQNQKSFVTRKFGISFHLSIISLVGMYV